MKPIERVLVPTDFSDCSLAALEHAAAIAARLGATVDAVHVLELPQYLEGQILVPSPSGESEALDVILLRRAGHEMERFLARGPRGVRAHLESGDPVGKIVELAKKGAYDLVVMGTHGKKRGVLTGSVTERVVRRAPCPVLAVREDAEAAAAVAS